MSNVDPLIEAITPPVEWYVVLRPFDGDHSYIRGEVVNGGGWRQTKRLIELRYLAPLPHGVDVPEPDEHGDRYLSLSNEQTVKVPSKKRPVRGGKIK